MGCAPAAAAKVARADYSGSHQNGVRVQILEKLGLEWLAVAGGAAVTLIVAGLATYWVVRESRRLRNAPPYRAAPPTTPPVTPPEQSPHE